MTDKLHCVRCGVEMSNFMDGAKGYQPNDGLAFKTHGHYGSTYFDPMDSSYLEIAVCDKCIKECEESGLVFRHETEALKCENRLPDNEEWEVVVHPSDLIIDWIGGNCPVQAEGTIGGKEFYFRARGQKWSIGIGGDPVMEPEWYHSEPYGEGPYDAGWMTEAEARSFIKQTAEKYLKETRSECE